MAHFEFIGKDHIKRGCHCQLEECSLDCALRRKLVNKPTNADRIRAMSDEEMAEIMVGDCPPNYPHGDCREYEKFDGNLDCCKCWLYWLKSPAEVDK